MKPTQRSALSEVHVAPGAKEIDCISSVWSRLLGDLAEPRELLNVTRPRTVDTAGQAGFSGTRLSAPFSLALNVFTSLEMSFVRYVKKPQEVATTVV